MPNSLPAEFSRLKRQVDQIKKGQRLSHGAALENAVLEVKDGAGSLRTIVGPLGDGTVGVQPVNGPPPPQPSAPVVAPYLGGVQVTWDGLFAGGAIIPMDWARIEVHASTAAGFAPLPETLRSTIETAQGATVIVPADEPVYVRLVARNTSGTASTPSAVVGPVAKSPVVANDILDGIVTTVKLAQDAVTEAKLAAGAVSNSKLQAGAVNDLILADDAVTAAKLATGAVDTAALANGAVLAEKLADLAVKVGKIDTGAVTGPAIAADAVSAGKIAADAVTTRELAANSVTASEIAADAVTTNALAAGSVTTPKMVVGSIQGDRIAVGTLNGDRVVANTITTSQLSVTTAASVLQKMYDAGAEAAKWRAGGSSTTTAAAIPGLTSVAVSDAQSGSYVMRAVGGVSSAWRPDILIPFDPNVLYRVSFTVRQTVAGSDTANQRIYAGVAGVAADGTTLVNITGAAAANSQHYVAAAAVNLTAGAGFQRFTGYLKGYAAGNGTVVAAPSPTAPGALHANARYITPVFYANYSGGTGTAEVDMFTVEVLETGAVQTVNIADGAISTPKLVAGAVQTATIAAGAVNADKIASGAVTTAKLDALAVTSDKIAANAITADKILAGSITATALSATAIDGKTITGAVIQTAATGQRITLNEGNQNMVLVYNSSGTAVGELSARGLGLLGSSGAAILVDPNAQYPQLRWLNASNNNSATAQISEPTTGDANLELTSGAFAGNGYTDMRWRLYLARDFANLDRIRASAPNTRIGGRFIGGPTFSQIGYANTDAPTTQSTLTVESGITTIDQARFQAIAPASAFSVLYGEAPTAHTGPMARLVRGGAEKFSVDKDGNTAIAGKLTAGNQAIGSVSITPSAAGVPTSASINFPALPGTVFRGFVTAQTTVPGDRTPTGNAGVTGVSISDVTATSALVWVNRQNTTSTTVNWQVISA